MGRVAHPPAARGTALDWRSVTIPAHVGVPLTDSALDARVYVLDTSVLLSDPRALGRFAEHEVVIPLAVLTQLEAKRHHPELGWAAREVLRMLEELRLAHGSLLRPMPANGEGGTLRVEVNHTDTAGFPAALSGETNDHRILAVGRNLAAEGRAVTVVTKDLPLRLKASIVGLDADEYRNELATDSNWSGVTELDVDGGTIDTLYDEHVVDLAEARDLPCNTGVVLHAGSQSALGRVHEDKRVHLARSDRALFEVRGRSAEQRLAIDLLADHEIGIVSLGGPAGTGKSVLALAAGLDAVLEQRTHNRVIVFRPIFPVGGQDLGYLPGSESEKMLPWGAAPGAHGAAHRAEPARPGQPGDPHPRRRPARQPARGPPRRHRVRHRVAEGPSAVRARDAHAGGAQPGGRPGDPGARRRRADLTAGWRAVARLFAPIARQNGPARGVCPYSPSC